MFIDEWFRVNYTRCLLLVIVVKSAASNRVAVLPSVLLVTLQLGGRFSPIADGTCGCGC